MPQEAPAAPSMPRGYLWALLGSIVASFGAFYLLLFGLSVTGNLSPPGFSNSLCVDEKLAYLRDRPASRPNLLVIGSSVAWRHFDGDAVRRVAPGSVPLSGAFCGLAANQSVYAANWLIDHQPTIREVLLIASPQDFENCSSNRSAVFDSADADNYVFNQASPWRYYIKYFAPTAIIRNAMTVAGRRSGANPMDPLIFDRYGSGPLDTTESRGMLLYGKVDGLDPACFTALRSLANRLKQDGRRLMVAATPMHPQWKSLYDPDNRMQQAFGNGIRQTLDATTGEYWDSNAAPLLGEDAFYDGIHLRWSAVAPFSEALARQFGFGAPASKLPVISSARL
jgi:hypothetical protein